jgi:hypothetical protein
VASLIVIALVTTVSGVLAGVFIAISISIRQGNRVKSLIWRLPERSAHDSRLLTGSSRRL